MSSKKFQNYLVFFEALSKIINFDCIMDLAIHIFLEEFQEIGARSSLKSYRLVDFESLN
jgi:hypothetical protein